MTDQRSISEQFKEIDLYSNDPRVLRARIKFLRNLVRAMSEAVALYMDIHGMDWPKMVETEFKRLESEKESK